jgi:hypothetical protein
VKRIPGLTRGREQELGDVAPQASTSNKQPLVICPTTYAVVEAPRRCGYHKLAVCASGVGEFSGRVLSPAFTLNWHKVKSGDTIVAYVSPPLRRPRIVPTHFRLSPNVSIAKLRGSESARLIDLDYSNLEMAPTFPRVLAGMLCDAEELRQKSIKRALAERTIIGLGPEIAERSFLRLLSTGERDDWRELLTCEWTCSINRANFDW